jgi:hypothetical protein
LVVHISKAIGADGDPNANEFDIANVPWNKCTFGIRVLKAGYTNGPVGYDHVNVNGQVYKRQVYYQAEDVSVPPVGDWSFVVNWGDDTGRLINLDAHILQGLHAGAYCDVGPAPPLALDGGYFCGDGALTASPYTELRMSSADIGRNFDALTFGHGEHLYLTNDVPYGLFVVSREPSLPTNGYATARMWRNGNIKRNTAMGQTTVFQSSPPCTFAGGDADCSVWLTFTIRVTSTQQIITRVDQVGDGVNLAKIPF